MNINITPDDAAVLLDELEELGLPVAAARASELTDHLIWTRDEMERTIRWWVRLASNRIERISTQIWIADLAEFSELGSRVATEMLRRIAEDDTEDDTWP